MFMYRVAQPQLLVRSNKQTNNNRPPVQRLFRCDSFFDLLVFCGLEVERCTVISVSRGRMHGSFCPITEWTIVATSGQILSFRAVQTGVRAIKIVPHQHNVLFEADNKRNHTHQWKHTSLTWLWKNVSTWFYVTTQVPYVAGKHDVFTYMTPAVRDAMCCVLLCADLFQNHTLSSCDFISLNPSSNFLNSQKSQSAVLCILRGFKSKVCLGFITDFVISRSFLCLICKCQFWNVAWLYQVLLLWDLCELHVLFSVF